MYKIFLKFVICLMVLFLTTSIFILFTWNNKIEFIKSNEVKKELITLKLSAYVEPYWYNDILSSEQATIKFTEDETIEYFVGVFYFLRNELSTNAESNILAYMGISKDDKQLVYNKLIQLEKTEYYVNLAPDEKSLINGDKTALFHYIKNSNQ